METGYRRDNEYFLRSVFVNSSVMWNRAQRNFIEERLPDHLSGDTNTIAGSSRGTAPILMTPCRARIFERIGRRQKPF